MCLYLHEKYQLTFVHANELAGYYKLQIVIMHYALNIRAEGLSSLDIFFVRWLLVLKPVASIFVSILVIEYYNCLFLLTLKCALNCYALSLFEVVLFSFVIPGLFCYPI